MFFSICFPLTSNSQSQGAGIQNSKKGRPSPANAVWAPAESTSSLEGEDRDLTVSGIISSSNIESSSSSSESRWLSGKVEKERGGRRVSEKVIGEECQKGDRLGGSPQQREEKEGGEEEGVEGHLPFGTAYHVPVVCKEVRRCCATRGGGMAKQKTFT